MKFNYPEGKAPDLPPEVEVGNVYGSRCRTKTHAWLIVAIIGRTAHALGLNEEGEISSTASYGVHAFERRNIIGKVDLSNMEFPIIPAPGCCP